MQYLWPLYQTIKLSATLCLILYVKVIENLTMSGYFQLIDEESNVIDLLRVYVEVENTRLKDLQKFESLLTQNKELYANENEFAWNPLAIYRTIKYLTVDLNTAKENMTRNSYDGVISSYVDRLPDEDHMYDEIRRLVGIQKAYNLTATDMMDGYTLDNTSKEPGLTIEDCFYVAVISAKKYDHKTATNWLQDCRNRFDDVKQLQISKMIILSALMTGDKSLAKAETDTSLYKDINDRILIDLQVKLIEEGFGNNDEQLRHSESLKACAGDYDNAGALRNLKCRYNHHNSFFLAIAPLKEEMLSFQPKVSVFRDIIYDSEIEMMKNDSYHLFSPATVLAEGVRVLELRYRPCQRAFLRNFGDPKYVNLRARLSDMTSLSLKFRENPQMLYYTPGSFYRAHSDFLRICTDCSVTGNRVASSLMYLSDVVLGGNTIFPFLKLNVKPEKGSALFWMNMQVDKEKEEMTEHASCPVVYGEKIAYTQWYRINGQSHWISEPEDDIKAHYSFNPNIRCARRDGKQSSDS